MSRKSPHYDQQNIGTCESFGWGRVMRKLMQSMFKFLPEGTMTSSPLSMLHMQRGHVSRARFQTAHLCLLLDYYYIHLVQYLRQMHHTRFARKGPEALLIRMHNNAYPIPLETVFKGKGDPTENGLLQRMLAEFSKFKLSLHIKKLPLPVDEAKPYAALLQGVVHIVPVLMIVSIETYNHLVEVIDMDDTHLVVRNAYLESEVVRIPISNMWSDPPEVDWLGRKCTIKRIFTFKVAVDDTPVLLYVLLRLKNPAITVKMEETSEVLRALVDEFTKLPKTKSTVEEPECVEEGECAVIYRVLEVVHGLPKAAVDKVLPLDPCPPLESWVKLVQSGFRGYTIDRTMQRQINQAVSIVAANAIEGGFDIAKGAFLQLMSNPSRRGIYTRLFPIETSLYTHVEVGDLAPKENEKMNPLPEILDRIVTGDEDLKEILLQTSLFKTTDDDLDDFFDREDLDHLAHVLGEEVGKKSRSPRTLSSKSPRKSKSPRNRTLALTSSSNSSRNRTLNSDSPRNRTRSPRKTPPKFEYL